MSVAATTDGMGACLHEHGVVAVQNYGFGHSTAACSCGWTGRRRYLKAAAVHDAWVHSMCEKCDVSVPLVIPVFAA